MAQVKCPNQDCQAVSHLPDVHVGRTVRCKKCNTRFKAEALPPEATNSVESDVVTVVARRIGAPPAGAPSGVFQMETMMADGSAPGIPAALAPRRLTGQRVAAVLALALPILVAGGFVASKALSGRDATAGETPPSGVEVYGAIEIGSKGVNAIVVERFADPEYGHDYRSRWIKSNKTGLASSMKDGVFDQQGLDKTVKAVRMFKEEMAKEEGLHVDKIVVVVGSGPFKAVRDNAELLAKNQAVLSAGVQTATGLKVAFIDFKKEAELQFIGLVPQKNATSSVLIDIGSGATRGGYRHAGAGHFISFEAPGVGAFAAKVRVRAGGQPFADVALQLSEPELRKPLRDEAERNAVLANRKRVYLAGGIVWVLATYQRQAERMKSHVPLSPDDIEVFAKLVRLHPKHLPPFVLQEGLDPKLKTKLEEDVARIQEIFTPQDLIAGAEVLRALSDELNFREQGRELYFTTYGHISWLLGYIAETHAARP